VRSKTFPNIGTGFGPGGKDAEDTLGFRNHMNRATRRQAEANNTETLVMAGEKLGRWWRKKLDGPRDGGRQLEVDICASWMGEDGGGGCAELRILFMWNWHVCV
jgi:hypothetical protein